MLLPLATLGVLVIGPLVFCRIAFTLVVLALLLVHGGPEKNGWVLPVGTLVGGLLLAACLRAQLFLRKVGRPPDTDDLDDQRLKLRNVEIIS